MVEWSDGQISTHIHTTPFDIHIPIAYPVFIEQENANVPHLDNKWHQGPQCLWDDAAKEYVIPAYPTVAAARNAEVFRGQGLEANCFKIVKVR